ncbi:MAG: bifunctional DNA primase/polymerase [Pseudonocardiales bacterium]|nr:bifunctional DNA primase/polymerase [Pseudonocardiales bacterium]
MSGTAMTVGWKALRDAAVKATRWGWPVMPGTFPSADRRWYGREGARRLCPIEDSWAQALVTDRVEAYEVWSEHPYGVLLVCGRGVDVLELPEEWGARLSDAKVPQIPLAVSSSPRQWLLFTTTGSGHLSPELTQVGVRLHTAGSWVALPPTTVEPMSPQRWLDPPPSSSPGSLREADEVQHALLTALVRSGLGIGIRR